MYKIRINETPAAYSECHSETNIKKRTDALAYLWALAKQDIPQFGICWLPMGIEPMTNIHMFAAEPPTSLLPKINEYLSNLNENNIESLVAQALNTIYDALAKRHGDDPDFVMKVTSAAEEWARECIAVDDDTPIGMGWVGDDGRP